MLDLLALLDPTKKTEWEKDLHQLTFKGYGKAAPATEIHSL